MKNLSLVLNLILLIAVGILFYLQLAGSNEPKESEASIVNAPEYAVAYVNSDSVLKKYDFFMDVQKQLQGKTQKLEAEYQNRAQGLQQELTDYQRNVNSLTIGQAKALEENLMKKQQNLRMYQESLSQELMKEEAKINKELYEKVTSFIEDYSKSNNLQLVVKFNQGSDVLYASDSMDITNAVIEGLNKTYDTEKNAEAATDSTASE